MIKYDKSKLTNEKCKYTGNVSVDYYGREKNHFNGSPKSYNSKDIGWLDDTCFDVDNSKYIMEEYHEGTMINVFWGRRNK